MRASVRRLALVILGSSLGSVGWGAVLPFLYADVSRARHLGPAVAALTFSALALGALVAAPIAGRLADRSRPVVVVTAARLAMVGSLLALAVPGGASLVVAAAVAYGAGYAIVQPATGVLVLELTPARRRRDAFAAQFIGLNLGLALGGLVGGWLIDLSTPTGARPVYVFAALATAVGTALVHVVGRDVQRPAMAVLEPGEVVGYRAILRVPGVRVLLTVTLLLMLACYAQYDAGLPAYALTDLHVAPATLGTAVAVNSVLVAALTAPIVRATRAASPANLLAICGAVFGGVWLILTLPLALPGRAAALLVLGYALFALGETMLAPVLTPLAATLAPAGAIGRTMALVNGAQTVATAIGPAIAAVLLGLGLPAVFLAAQVLCAVAAVAGARGLRRVLPVPAERRAAGRL